MNVAMWRLVVVDWLVRHLGVTAGWIKLIIPGLLIGHGFIVLEGDLGSSKIRVLCFAKL